MEKKEQKNKAFRQGQSISNDSFGGGKAVKIGNGSVAGSAITLTPDTARQAVILSEIIGKPLSKRGRRRM